MPPKRFFGRPAMSTARSPADPRPPMTTKPTDGPEPDGYCKPTICVLAAGHVANMNKQCQWILDNLRPDDKVPYHDIVRYDKDGYFVPPPADVRLSDRLVFLIIANNLYPGKQRNARWPPSNHQLVWHQNGVSTIWPIAREDR
ncbi:unnamed protein product [Penicillium viridicatum]